MERIEVEKHRKHFKNHIATLTDYGNIKILDFKNPESNHYRIRFLFEEDYYRLHISGDLGALQATNYTNMTYEEFSQFLGKPDYFKSKIDCIERAIYIYDNDFAAEQLKKILEDYGYEPEYDFETIDDKIEEILRDFTEENGIGSNGYEELKEIVGLDYMYTYIYPEDIGKVDKGIIDLYLFAFELAIKQLEERA